MKQMHDIDSIHFIGITGVAMTALAIYMKERGIHVTGSDIPGDFPTIPLLHDAHIVWKSGFSPDHIDTHHMPDLIIYTGAHIPRGSTWYGDG